MTGLALRKSRNRRLASRVGIGFESLEARQMLDATVDVKPGLTFDQFDSATELEQFLIDDAVSRYRDLFGQPGYGIFPWWRGGPVMFMADAGAALPPGNNHSETNTQVAGVDEGDIVETDGDYLYVLSGGQLVIVDALPAGEMKVASRVSFEGTAFAEYLAGDRLAVLSYPDVAPQPLGGPIASFFYVPYRPHVQLTVFDVSDRDAPRVVQKTVVEGSFVDSRTIGTRLYLASQSDFILPAPETHCTPIEDPPPPDDPGGDPGGDVVNALVADRIWLPPMENCFYETQDEYLARISGQVLELAMPDQTNYSADVGATSIGTFTSVGSTSPYVEDQTRPLTEATQIYRPRSVNDTNLVSISVFDLAANESGTVTSTGLPTTWSSEVYVSPENFYLINPDWGTTWTGSAATSIVQFDLDDGSGNVVLVAAGSVPGTVLNQFSVDEFGGYVRIATTDGWGMSAVNALYVLQRSGTELALVGSIVGLAPGERIFSARFLGTQAFIVTFRQIDPLFAIDLSDPTQPTVEGELHIPGFSNYLQQLDAGHLFGIGRDANATTGQPRGVQVSLFNVMDMTDPQLVDRYTIDDRNEWWWSSTEAASDHHAVGYFPEYDVLAIPVSNSSSSISIDRNDDGITDIWTWRPVTDLWVFRLHDDSGARAIELLGRVHHDANMRRSVRIGDVLYAISDHDVSAHPILDPDTTLATLHFGQEIVGIPIVWPTIDPPVTETPPSTPDDIPPQVAQLTIGGSSWSDAVVSELERQLASGTGSSAIVSHEGANQIKVRFTEDVFVGSSDLVVSDGAEPYYIAGFQYEATTHTAVWTLSRSLSVGEVSIELVDAITDIAGNSFDGNADGSAGAGFATSFGYLPGDLNRDRIVDRRDLVLTLKAQFTRVGQTGYDLAADIDGNGVVNVADSVRVRNLRGTSLPGAPSPAVVDPPASGTIGARRVRHRDADGGLGLTTSRRRLNASAVDAVVTPPAADAPVSQSAARRRR